MVLKRAGYIPLLFFVFGFLAPLLCRAAAGTQKNPLLQAGDTSNFLKLQADRADGAGAGARAAFNAFGGVDGAFAVLFGNGAYGAS